KILAKPHGLKVEKLEDLTEAKLKPEFVGKVGRYHILTTPDAFTETYEELQDRVLMAVHTIRKGGKGNAIMVSHGDVIVSLLDSVVERKVGKSRDYVIHPDPGSLSIIELRGTPKLLLFNYRRKLLDNF
ncbi:MAG: histidine phosphatase family protein, partial [Thaumarchaeota archaeon]|nr:histidine phosphatase family protein [Nitrososphaerota archaeon]